MQFHHKNQFQSYCCYCCLLLLLLLILLVILVITSKTRNVNTMVFQITIRPLISKKECNSNPYQPIEDTQRK